MCVCVCVPVCLSVCLSLSFSLLQATWTYTWPLLWVCVTVNSQSPLSVILRVTPNPWPSLVCVHPYRSSRWPVVNCFASVHISDGYNDVKLQWIAYDNWTYKLTFTPHDLPLLGAFFYIKCDGLDTVANVRWALLHGLLHSQCKMSNVISGLLHSQLINILKVT